MIMRDMCYDAVNNGNISLFGMLMKVAKINSKQGWFHRPKFFEDINRVPQSYKDIVIKSFVLGRFFKKMTAPGEHVALLLPNALANLCTLFGLSAYERIPVMLNFSVGSKNMVSMCNTAQVKMIITSHLFIRNAKLESVVDDLRDAGYRIFYLEDMRKFITLRDKIEAYIRYKVKRVPHPDGGNKKAVILFTSGSEGAPKAVVLSHANIISNVDQLSCIETLTTKDTLLNALPMFHSFGLTVGTFFPIFKGSKLFLYPSPLHYRIIAELSYEIGATALLGTDTFFRGYAKIAHPMDFRRLRIMYGGAEAVKSDTRNLWGEDWVLVLKKLMVQQSVHQWLLQITVSLTALVQLVNCCLRLNTKSFLLMELKKVVNFGLKVQT
jgi:acyl-[acyl-carrier-protein]-phospholipid O-acyltransferase/long-chain-fatty-acid--[acyl-carrier-protein] ligase